ncbi:hypothetical protein KSP39_PZI004868 [Platanthera zijinensis]|uniref:PRLI-interacting factor A n=1 Tax=Platanthera zijinensis TaxID=2320716 RepID=A0AAP0BXS8_9ASPA
MNDPSQMVNRTYGMWQPQQSQAPTPQPPPATAVPEDTKGFQNPRSVFVPVGVMSGRTKWKSNKRKRSAAPAGSGAMAPAPLSSGAGVNGISAFSGYMPPTLSELQHQNRLRARRFYPKKKHSSFAPFAPRNTTSFIIRAKKSGGIASLVSPCPVTPAILPTPTFSPSREGLVDMAKEEWGVDGYGSMKGLIRLRPPTSGCNHGAGWTTEEEDADDGSSESDVEEHVEVERRLDHDLSRFEIVYPSFAEEQGVAASAAHLLENRVGDQDTHIAQLEEENLTLRERLFLLEREMGEIRRRVLLLETDYRLRNEMKDDNNGNNNLHGEDNLSLKEAASENNDGGGDVDSEKSTGDFEDCTEGS